MTNLLGRRQFLKSGAAGLALCAFPQMNIVQVQAATSSKPPSLSIHLPLWHQGGLQAETFWTQLFSQLADHNFRHCLILIYRFVDPVTGKISNRSQYQEPLIAPHLDFLGQGLEAAKSYDIQASLYPMLEIDNNKTIGTVWRGYLNFFGVTLRNFFQQYTNLLLELADKSIALKAPYFYIGSELASLTHNSAARGLWEQLIFELRTKIQKSSHPSMNLTYAAHWEEYLTVPFWRQLDQIGINAYFPLTDYETARGIKHPPQTVIENSLKHQLGELEQFSRAQKRPLALSEFGLTPFDQTTARPWQQSPSEINDPNERQTAYRALFRILQDQSSWLTSVNLWHWQLPGRMGSAYNISANSELAKLITAYSSPANR